MSFLTYQKTDATVNMTNMLIAVKRKEKTTKVFITSTHLKKVSKTKPAKDGMCAVKTAGKIGFVRN